MSSVVQPAELAGQVQPPDATAYVRLLDDYARQAAHTDDVIATRDWDAEAVGRDENTGKPFALRYIITHLIAETARHNGHLDILRELADGVTGD